MSYSKLDNRLYNVHVHLSTCVHACAMYMYMYMCFICMYMFNVGIGQIHAMEALRDFSGEGIAILNNMKSVQYIHMIIVSTGY